MPDLISVLVVDDEWLEVETFCHLLRDDLRVRIVGTAGSGQEALQLARRAGPDLVLMDIRMPGMDGLEAARLLRAESPGARVVIVTAHGEFEYARQALSQGASSYLLKPVRAEELHEAVTRVEQTLAQERAERLHLEGDLLRNLMRGRKAHPPDQERELVWAVRSGEVARAGQICRDLAAPAATRERPELLAVLADLLLVLERAALAAGANARQVESLRAQWIERITAIQGGGEGLDCAAAMGAAFAEVAAATFTTGARRLVARAQAYVDTHYAGDLSLEATAEQIGVHPSYLSRLFRRETRQSFIDYLTERRLEESKQLLGNPDLILDQVANRVGFRSANYFSTVFKRRFGQSPGEFRRQ